MASICAERFDRKFPLGLLENEIGATVERGLTTHWLIPRTVVKAVAAKEEVSTSNRLMSIERRSEYSSHSASLTCHIRERAGRIERCSTYSLAVGARPRAHSLIRQVSGLLADVHIP